MPRCPSAGRDSFGDPGHSTSRIDQYPGRIVLPGRVAHGEKHLYDFCWAETLDLLFRDVLRLHSAHVAHRKSIARVGEYDVIAAQEGA
jgi:hypothetical protein